MVSSEEIRLATDEENRFQKPGEGNNPIPGWMNGAAGEDNQLSGDGSGQDTVQEDNGQEEDASLEGEDQVVQPDNDQDAQAPAEDNNGQQSNGQGRVSGASGGEDTPPEGELPLDENGNPIEEEGKSDAVEGKDVPELITKEKDTEGEAGTEQPWGIQIDTGNGWMWGGLALVVVLLGCAAADYIRRALRKKKRSAAAPSAAACTSGGSIAVAEYQNIGAREDQQDSYDFSHPDLYAQQGVMAVVADGMGGLANGKAVSSALVRTFIDGFPQVSGYYTQTADILLDLSIRANARVNQMLRGAERSGSTLVAALVRDGFLHFLTVGDSRIYLYRGGALLQLNREHIYQEELAVKAVNQAVAMAQVRSDRQAHALTSYFGIGRIPSIDRNDEGIRLVPGDRILLASDGVFGTLSRDQMEQALNISSIQEAADQMGQMIRTADKPYQDNNTLVILEYKG